MQTESDLTRAINPDSNKRPDKDEEYSMARQQFSLFTRAYNAGHDDYLEIKEKCNNFYIGDQWDQKDLTRLAAEGRPALSINMVLSTVNVVLGEQIGRRVDIQFKPRKEATTESAIALTKLANSITDMNQFEWLESEVFADGLIEERGYYEVRMNFDKNIQGECEINTVDGGDIIPDPDATSYDPAKWKEVWRIRWLSLDEVEETYGKKARTSLESVAGTRDHFGKESIRRTKNTFGKTDEPDEMSYEQDEESESFLVKVRVIERQFYKNTTVYSLVDMATGQMRELPVDTKKDEAERFAAQLQVGLIKQVKPKVRWRITADQFVLHDDWSIYRSFTYIPFFAYFRRGKPFGMVRNLLSPQEQYNKLSSQELHIVNTTANSGYIVEKGTLHGMTADDLRDQGSKTGVVIEVNPGRMAGIDKIKPNSIPTGIDRITQKSQQNIKEISGISDALLGMETGEVSGVALESKERRGQVQIQVPIDNLSRTRHLVAGKLLELIKDFYTDERVVFYTNDMEPGQPSESTVINEQQPDGSVTNSVTTGEYDIVIGSLPARDNFRDTQFAEALNLRNVGIEIPDYRVIQYSNLAHKDEVAAEVRNLSGLGEQTPEQQEAQMREQEATLADLEASVKEKLARAEEMLSKSDLNVAKAEETTNSTEQNTRELEFKDVADQRSTELRERLAHLSALNKLDVTELANRLKSGDTNETQRPN
jgi:hypothetical protein